LKYGFYAFYVIQFLFSWYYSCNRNKETS